MKSNNNNRGVTYALVVLSMLFWGVTFVWTKDTLKVYNPISIITLRLPISAILLFSYLFITKKFERIRKGDFKWFLLLALFSPFLYFIGETYGIKLTSSTISSVFIATIPLFCAITAVFVFKEKLTRLNIFGMLLSFMGLLLVIINTKYRVEISLKGVLFLSTAIFASVADSWLLKKLSEKYNAVTVVAYQNLIGIFYFIPLFLIMDYSSFVHIVPSWHICLNILYLSVFGSSLAFIFYTRAIRELGVGKAAFFTNLIPIFTAITAFFIINEKLSPLNIIGIIIVTIGLNCSQRKGK